MEKKVVLAELDYIFNVVKGSFNPVALAKYLTAAGAWNKYVRDKAKSYGIVMDPKYNIENAVRGQVKKKINDFESEQELIEDWVMAYLFLPEALQEFDYTDEDGKDQYKWRKNKPITSVFESFVKKDAENPDKESNFAGWVNSAITGTINKYIKLEKRNNAPFVTEENDSGVKQKMDKELAVKPKQHMQEHKQVEEKDDKGEVYGITPGDMDKIQSIGDFRDNVLYKELRSAVKTYVKEKASPEANKVMKLKLINPDMKNKEIAEKLKKTEGTISGYLQELAKVIMDFAYKSDNVDLAYWLKTLTTYFKEENSPKKSSSIDRIASIFDELESLFNKVPTKDAKKIASITQYINVLCDKLV